MIVDLNRLERTAKELTRFNTLVGEHQTSLIWRIGFRSDDSFMLYVCMAERSGLEPHTLAGANSLPTSADSPVSLRSINIGGRGGIRTHSAF